MAPSCPARVFTHRLCSLQVCCKKARPEAQPTPSGLLWLQAALQCTLLIHNFGAAEASEIQRKQYALNE